MTRSTNRKEISFCRSVNSLYSSILPKKQRKNIFSFLFNNNYKCKNYDSFKKAI